MWCLIILFLNIEVILHFYSHSPRREVYVSVICPTGCEGRKNAEIWEKSLASDSVPLPALVYTGPVSTPILQSVPD